MKPSHHLAAFAVLLALRSLSDSADIPFRAPAGCVVERVAAPPMVEHPMMAGFDDSGRLYVADASGKNLDADQLLRELPSRIVRLEDTDGDGQFDRSTVFADKMTLPMGALWHQGALYVASPPSIWKLEDTDGDGRADRRTELIGKFGFIGNAADIHGCFLGPEGRIYWCDGRHGHDIPEGPAGAARKGKAARIFCCWPDGSGLEVLAGGGMDNPVELDFTESGECLGTCALFDGSPRREDALVHWVHGGVYPRADQAACLAEFPRTGPLLPPVIRFGQVAPSGVVLARGRPFSGLLPSTAETAYLCEFNTHKVVRCVLTRQGASFATSSEDFLVSDHPDVHPTDCLEDADGSLIVLDTGGWFRIGCPLSVTAKPEVRGSIYRVRRIDAKPVSDPWGKAIPWKSTSAAQLATLLGDERPKVRQRAMDEMTARGTGALPALSQSLDRANERIQRNALWVLCRGRLPESLPLIRRMLSRRVPSSTALAAALAAGVRKDPAAVPGLIELLRAHHPAVQREAATSLGRIGNAAAIPALFSLLSDPLSTDPFLTHAAIYALIEIADPGNTRPGLAHPDPAVRRGALIALDQMRQGRLTAAEVAAQLESPDPALVGAAIEILSRSAEGSRAAITWIERVLANGAVPAAILPSLSTALSAYAREPAVARAVAKVLKDSDAPPETVLALLEWIARLGSRWHSPEWTPGIRYRLESSDSRMIVSAIAAARGDSSELLTPALSTVAHKSPNVAARKAALVALAERGVPMDQASFGELLANLGPSAAPLERLATAEVLAAAILNPAQQERLAHQLHSAGALELRLLLTPFEKKGSVELGALIADELGRSPVLSVIGSERLRRLKAFYPGSLADRFEELARRSSSGAEPVDPTKVQAVAAASIAGQPERGRAVFFGPKTMCFACHRIGKDGGDIGPDLSQIGRIRQPADLAEAILYPSSTFARGYEAYTVVLHSGVVASGIFRRQTEKSLELVDGNRQVRQIDRSDIDQMTLAVSIMPAGLDKTLTARELADLIAFLRNQR